MNITDNTVANPKLAKLADFRNYLFYLWHHLEQIKRDPTAIQYEIAHFMQHGGKRIGVEAFRGVGKSWICSGFVSHQLWLNPALNILVVSASKTRADDFSTFTLRLFQEIPILKHLQPRSDQRFSKISFDVGLAPASHAPSVKSLGITSQLTGSRADIIVVDDCEVPTNSATQAMRDKLSEQVKEFDAIIKPHEDTKIIFLGTPQCEDTLYAKLGERGYKFRIWPAEYVCPKTAETLYGDRVSSLCVTEDADLVGSTTEPTRFSDLDLNERRLSYGKQGFALQFMLNPTLSDADKFPLKLRDLIVSPCDVDVAHEKLVWAGEPDLERSDLPCYGLKGDRLHRPLQRLGDMIPYTGSVMAIDPSGRGSDETGVAVVKMLNGFLHAPVLRGLRGGYDDSTLQQIAQTAKDQKVNEIVIEANFGDGMFTELLKPVLKRNGYPVRCTEVKHSIQKEKRICDVLEPVMARHRLVVDPEVIRWDAENIKQYPLENQIYYSFMHQLTRITRERGALRHDDRLDVLAIAVAYWTERMAVDEDEEMKDREDGLFQAEIERFMNSVLNTHGGGNKALVGFRG